MQTEIRSIKMLQLLHYFTPLERVVIGEGRVPFFFCTTSYLGTLQCQPILTTLMLFEIQHLEENCNTL